MNIFVSSCAVKGHQIGDVVTSLADHGFVCIELTGGTQPYPGLTEDLLKLKAERGLTFLCHNYFPPPEKNFVLNLASLDEDIYQRSVRQLEMAVSMSKTLGCDRFSFHAGSLTDIPPEEIGKEIRKRELAPRREALKRFQEGFRSVQAAAKGLPLYLENSVCADHNYKRFGRSNPFMLTTHEEYLELCELIDFNLLLDVGHLKVICDTLGLHFERELSLLAPCSDYWHTSDNDGRRDLNLPLTEGSDLHRRLSNLDCRPDILTLEIRAPLSEIERTARLLEQ